MEAVPERNRSPGKPSTTGFHGKPTVCWAGEMDSMARYLQGLHLQKNLAFLTTKPPRTFTKKQTHHEFILSVSGHSSQPGFLSSKLKH
jgi:hypothetical protein